MTARRRRRRGRPAAHRPPALQIADRGRPRTPRPFLRAVVRAALEHAGRADLPVSLLLTDDAGIARLHARFCGDATPTDVLTFELDGAAEIAISVETASRCAARTGHGARAEIALYVVHGVLHACGFDDRRARDRARMRAAERAVLARLDLEIASVDDRS
jgi:probable rRNA maturation factor